MIDDQSNTSRLVDKLVAKGFISRTQCNADRRQLDICLSESGNALVDEATRQVDELTRQLFGHFSESKLGELNTLLDDLRTTEKI